MKHCLLILATLFILCSCNKSQVKSEGETQNGTDSIAIGLLNSIYDGSGRADIFNEEWIDANCTLDMKQALIDAYDYEGEGFGSWIIGGWEAGEDIAQKVSAIQNENSDYFVTLEPTESDLPIKGHRVIRFTMVYVDGQPKIDKCQWVENYEWVD